MCSGVGLCFFFNMLLRVGVCVVTVTFLLTVSVYNLFAANKVGNYCKGVSNITVTFTLAVSVCSLHVANQVGIYCTCTSAVGLVISLFYLLMTRLGVSVVTVMLVLAVSVYQFVFLHIANYIVNTQILCFIACYKQDLELL